MPRYYSLEQIKSAVKITHEKYGGMTEEFDLLKLLQMPPADVVPVKHGKWEYIGGYGYQYRCSECVMCAEHKKNYCPNCGARMDGDKNE